MANEISNAPWFKELETEMDHGQAEEATISAIVQRHLDPLSPFPNKGDLNSTNLLIVNAVAQLKQFLLWGRDKAAEYESQERDHDQAVRRGFSSALHPLHSIRKTCLDNWISAIQFFSKALQTAFFEFSAVKANTWPKLKECGIQEDDG